MTGRESPDHEADVTVIEECIQESSEFNGLEGCIEQQNVDTDLFSSQLFIQDDDDRFDTLAMESCYQEGAGLEGAPLAKKAAASYECPTCERTFSHYILAPKSKRSRPTPPHPPAPVAAASSSWDSDSLSVPANLLAIK
ncbi:hypothetical protein ACROYT_G003619 [Oculina patagonica]